MWGERPTEFQDVYDIFVKYLKSEIKMLPWCDTPILPETGTIRKELITMNKQGMIHFTVMSLL